MIILLLAQLHRAHSVDGPSADKARKWKRGGRAWDNVSDQGAAELAALGLTRLLVHAVADSTLQKYIPAVRRFLLHLRRQRHDFRTVSELDWRLAQYVDWLCYSARAGFAEGSACFSGLTSMWPEVKDKLPLAARSLIAWQRLAIHGEGGPIPLQAIIVIAIRMIELGHPEAALATLLAEDGYLRESDWSMIQVTDIVTEGQPQTPRVALILGAQERGDTTKTGDNQGIVVETLFVCLWVAQLAKRLRPSQSLIGLKPEAYRRIWWKVLDDINARSLGPPHSLRHSRPAAQCRDRSRTLEEIRRRGRWISLKSVQRYTKDHLLLKALAALPPGLRDRGDRYLQQPAAAFGAAWRRMEPAAQQQPAAVALQKACKLFGSASYDAGRASESKGV